MGGWLVQVPVKRFGTEALVHLYAVWMPDHTDAMAAVEKRVGLTRSRSYSSSWQTGQWQV